MKHVNYEDVPLEIPAEEGIKDLKIRWLISEADGAENFAMRMFEAEPGGNSPWHNHDWEHEVFILEGEGTARSAEGEAPIKAGDVLFIPPNTQHQLINTGDKLLRFLCLIPIKKK